MANRYPLIVDSSSQQIKEFPSGDTLVIDNLQVTGTTTTLETATLNVEDKNITINYSTGDSSSTADGSGLTFQDAVNASTDATILWGTTNDRFQFSHGIEVTSGNLLVGKTAFDSSIEGFMVDNRLFQTTDGLTTAYFNRLTNDGNIVELRKDGTTVGSIGVGSNQLIIDASASNLVLENSTRVITFSSSAFAGSGSGNDAVIDLGISNRRFKNLYLSGGVYVGGTSAANALDDYEEGTWTPALYTYSGVTTTSITINLATYTKIGNIVHIHANIDVTLSSLPGQTVTITGLPFAASNASDTGQRAIIALGGDTANTGGNTSKAHFRTNGSQLDGVYFNASHNTALWNYATMDSPTFALHIHGFYTV